MNKESAGKEMLTGISNCHVATNGTHASPLSRYDPHAQLCPPVPSETAKGSHNRRDVKKWYFHFHCFCFLLSSSSCSSAWQKRETVGFSIPCSFFVLQLPAPVHRCLCWFQEWFRDGGGHHYFCRLWVRKAAFLHHQRPLNSRPFKWHYRTCRFHDLLRRWWYSVTPTEYRNNCSANRRQAFSLAESQLYAARLKEQTSHYSIPFWQRASGLFDRCSSLSNTVHHHWSLHRGSYIHPS